DILVENMGRINYGAEIIHNLKGIILPVMIDSLVIKGDWEMYKLPMDSELDLKLFGDSYHANHPVIYRASFKLTDTGDTFLDMSSWGKGIVFVNGHNLGRYWNVGPQQTLYLPGCWLNKGVNHIMIFDEQNQQKHSEINTTKTPELNELKVSNND
ncbi:MAG: beta-galactosidase, partial [Ginsengibacter sp.]